MAAETRTFEELKAEQSEPEGYDTWFRDQVEIALQEANVPGSVTYTAEDVDRFMAERRAQRDAGLLGKAS